MSQALFFLDRSAPQPLQSQLRQRIIEAIVSGSLAPGARMASTRRLADDLAIARNTVSLVYQQLVADGYLTGRERSGVFVTDVLSEPSGSGRPRPAGSSRAALPWRPHLRAPMAGTEPEVRSPPNWELNPFPFLDGAYDASLSPAAEWRDAARATLTAAEYTDWSQDSGELDDPRLVHEIRTKLLPRRGVQAAPEEVLVVGGRRAAFSLLAQAFVAPGVTVAVEEPGFADLRPLLALHGAIIAPAPVDGGGIVAETVSPEARLLFVTPACQFPTGARLSPARARALLMRAQVEDRLIVEYDHAASGGFTGKAAPALRGLEDGGRVIYVAELCDVLSPGLGLGVIVADSDLVRALRRLRTLTAGAPPRATQRTAAFFLALGHYDAILRRQQRVLRARLNALRDALNYHLPQLVAIDPRSNGSAIWVEGPPGLSARQLANEAAKRGVLIEPADRFGAGSAAASNAFRMGVTALPLEKIRPGVAVLAEVIRNLTQPGLDRLDAAVAPWMDGETLAGVMAGAKLLCRTTYGDPYEVDVLPDGRLIGRAGYAHEDCDVGVWWMEGDFWCRRWSEWSYGEVARFLTVIDGDQIRWYRPDHLLFNRGVIKVNVATEPAAFAADLAP